jgi:hypothetical protein
MKYDKATLIKRLRSLAKRIGRTPTAEDITAEPGFPSYPTFQRHFGSLDKAREEAGLAPPERKRQWTAPLVIEGLKRAARELGRTPTVKDVDRLSYLPDSTTVRSACGSWPAALKAAGLKKGPRRKNRSTPTDDELLAELTRVAKTREPPLTKSAYDAAKPKYSAKRLTNRFGSWAAALEKVGLTTAYESWEGTEEDLLAAIRTLAKRMDRVPRAFDLDNYSDLPPQSAYKKFFGSWIEALIAARVDTSLPPVPYDDLTDNQFLDALRELARRLGRTPDSKVGAHVAGFPSVPLYRSRFGSWNNAIRAAGLPENRRKYRAKDKHLCDSKQEKMVDDFLFDHKIRHTLHPLYPRDPELNPLRSLVADWRLDQFGVLVEYFGVLNKPWYEERRRQKEKLAKKHGVRLVAVTPDDLRPELLPRLFAPYLPST